ncbi:hypothetical protein [Piscinibacter sp. XHJ-5]|uniref:hypothetical protein n=1 Tax=Piscinibacter sp. XHJ-5 TaxID=3037797 RepID=UPI0024532474|nr:hypothetical protein [Piscinibacter sp. XHJ-5]
MSAVVPDSAELAEAEAQADAKAVSEAVKDVDVPSAAERLAQSRERLREWMLHADGRQQRRRRAAEAAAEGRSLPLLDRLREMPVIGLLIDVFAGWWASHPLQPAATLAHGVVRDTVAPMARRHPFTVVAGAFVVGVALVRFKPWRWIVKPALFAGLATQIVSRVIASIPVESVVDAMSSFTQRREQPAPEADAEASASSQAPAPRETETATP